MKRPDVPAESLPPGKPARGTWGEPIGEGEYDPPVGVEIRHLAALEAIGCERSFRGAADSLGYVQSAVSHQIAALERLVGARLVERSRGNAPVSLTPAGDLLMAHSVEIMAEFRTAHAKLAALDEGRAGTLRVGAPQSIAANVVPRVIASFTKSRPEFRVTPNETNEDTPLFGLLRRGMLDLAFCESPLLDGPFEATELMSDPFVLLVSESSALAERDEAPSLAEIARHPLVGFNTSRSQDTMVRRMAQRGLVPRFAFRTDLNPTMQSLVAADIGIAIVPYLTIDPLHPGTTVFALDELGGRTISLIWHRDRGQSDAERAFAETARAVCPRFRGATGLVTA
jgi:DNA-binding transcriptional LysR family regulator